MGNNIKTKNYFENWYFRLVDANKEKVVEILVGKSMGEKGTEAFIQIMGEGIEEPICMTYPVEKMINTQKGIQIEENSFGAEGIELNLSSEKFSLKGEMSFHHHKMLKQSFWLPGLMGPFKYLPFLESYHEVICLDHVIMGNLVLNEKTLSFDKGKGYIEKDWGKTFPKVWVWAQCNHFEKHDMAVMIGIARVPIFLEYHTGFAIPIFYNDKLEVFSNYRGGQIAKLYRYKGYIHLIVTQKNMVLDIKIYGSDEISCTTSRSTHMIRDVYSCEQSKIEIKMMKDNQVIFEDIGQWCALEMGGNTSKLK